MKIVSTAVEVQAIAQEYRDNGLKIGLVPTMGWFHEGHLALMKEAGNRADKVIVSLFVNPIQFGLGEDLDNYPHDLERDCKLAEEVGVDVLYAPTKDLMYPGGFSTTVHIEGLTSGLCGADRPGHFDGVTTVVSKLFNQTLPHVAVFGEKDFQQLAVIRQLACDLDFPIEIIGHPIVREKSGLAMSSRNSYLKKDELNAALSLSEGIASGRKLALDKKEVSVQEIKKTVADVILKHPECDIDYIEVVDQATLQKCEDVTSDSMLVLAVTINKRIRLLDNSKIKGS
jgi:pantoate--beta-alanine ligase